MQFSSNTSGEEEGNGLMSSYRFLDNDPFPEAPQLNEIRQDKSPFCFFISTLLYVVSVLSLCLFAIFMILRLDDDISWRYSKIVAFFYFGIGCLWMLANVIIIQNSQVFNNFLGKCFLVFCLNCLLPMVIIFAALITIRLKGDIDWAFSVIFIPIYFIMSIIFIFICFILPGLLDSSVRMYKEAIIISSQYFALLLTIILVVFKIDKNLKLYYFEIFILEEAMLLILFFLQIFKFKRDSSIRQQIEGIILVFSLFAGVFVVGLRLDEIIEGPWKLVLIPFCLVGMGIVVKSYQGYSFFCENDKP